MSIRHSLREKCPNTELLLVLIFLYSDWIRRDTPYLSLFSPNTGKYGPEITPYLDTFHAVKPQERLTYLRYRSCVHWNSPVMNILVKSCIHNIVFLLYFFIFVWAMEKEKGTLIRFFSIRVFFTDTDDSKNNRGRGGPSFIPLYHFHPLTNSETFICMWDDYHVLRLEQADD